MTENHWVPSLKEPLYPILEFDPAPTAIIEPSRIFKPRDVPEHAVLCFFQEAITRVCGDGRAQVLFTFKWEDAPHIVYELHVNGKQLAVMHPGVGAPMAAGLLEEWFLRRSCMVAMM